MKMRCVVHTKLDIYVLSVDGLLVPGGVICPVVKCFWIDIGLYDIFINEIYSF